MASELCAVTELLWDRHAAQNDRRGTTAKLAEWIEEQADTGEWIEAMLVTPPLNFIGRFKCCFYSFVY